MDIRKTWNLDHADVTVFGDDLATDEGLETAVIVSLFTDRRAPSAAELPAGETNRRGWWGDTYLDLSEDRYGSHLWLLSREKTLQEVANRAREYAERALQWMLDEDVAARLEVDAELQRPDRLNLEIRIWRPGIADPMRLKYDYNWRAQAGKGGESEDAILATHA